jgi:S1-C subfamily serine protease
MAVAQSPAQPTGARIEPALLKAVVRIEAPATAHTAPSVGTGFLVSVDPASGSAERTFFLVTNKHVIGDWTLADGDIKEYRQFLNVSMYGGTGGAFTTVAIPLTDTTGVPIPGRLRLAANPQVDVAVLHISDVAVASTAPLTFNSFDPSYFLPFDKITAWMIGVGDQVFAIGYPLGITSATTSYPLAKAGYLASTPGEIFAINVPTTRRNGTTTMVRLEAKLLVVDGLIVPGNSGGPVIAPSDLRIRRNPQTGAIEFATKQSDNFVLGVVSMGLGSSGLTLCFSSDYVKDLLPSK